MAKKESTTSFSVRKYVYSTLILAVVGLALWVYEGNSLEGPLGDIKDSFSQFVENEDISTLETKYSPLQIIETHRNELVTNEKKSVQEPLIKYYPYLLLEVKYPDENKTKEGVLLWSFVDGEIVINTDTWEKTRGFKDCLDANASRDDYRILQALAKKNGIMTLDELQKDLKLEREILMPWVESAKKKHLVLQRGHVLQLHFENPKFLPQPQTKLKQQLVSKPVLNQQKVAKKYQKSQIIAAAKGAFGPDFKIRKESEIFLPVYRIEVLNADGSTLSTEWNALTGHKLSIR